MLTFNKILTMVIIEIVTDISVWLNIFPTTDGISTTISPRTPITGIQINYIKSLSN